MEMGISRQQVALGVAIRPGFIAFALEQGSGVK
jgi:hypothetical protein